MDTMRSAGKRGLVLAPVAALLLSVAALLLGNGLLSTLLIVRAGHKGFSTGAISAMMSLSWSSFFEHPDRESAAQACTDAGLSWHCLSNSAGLILPSAEFRRFWL